MPAVESPNAWSVIGIDLFGTFCSSRTAAHACFRRRNIVNISMTFRYRGWPQMAHATAAKEVSIGSRVRSRFEDSVGCASMGCRPVPTGVLKFARPRSGAPVPSPTWRGRARRAAAAEGRRAARPAGGAIPLGRWELQDIAGRRILASPAAVN